MPSEEKSDPTAMSRNRKNDPLSSLGKNIEFEADFRSI
jgi:hypothetical protein